MLGSRANRHFASVIASWLVVTSTAVYAQDGVRNQGQSNVQQPAQEVAQETVETERVVLLHGLGRTSWSMLRMEAALSRAGYETHNLGYPSTEHSIAELTEQIGEKIRACCSDGSVHFVTHSLGGILVRSFLADGDFENVGRVVMLAPPNQGSEIVDILADQRLFRHGLGPSGSELGTDPTSVPNQLRAVDFPLGVITGDQTINPLFSWWIPGQDDGKVSVESAKVEGMVDFLVLPYTHTFIMNATEVIDQTEHFLVHGRFDSQHEP